MQTPDAGHPPERIPGFAEGGIVPGLPGSPMAAIVHGGERVLTREQQQSSGPTIHQENHFHNSTPAAADLEFANRQLGWRLSRLGRY